VNKVEEFFANVFEAGEPDLLIVGNGIGMIDLAGAEMLEREAEKRKLVNRGFYICSLRKPVRDYLEKGEFTDSIGADNMFETKIAAIQKIYSTLDKGICASCSVRIFNECKQDG